MKSHRFVVIFFLISLFPKICSSESDLSNWKEMLKIYEKQEVNGLEKIKTILAKTNDSHEKALAEYLISIWETDTFDLQVIIPKLIDQVNFSIEANVSPIPSGIPVIKVNVDKFGNVSSIIVVKAIDNDSIMDTIIKCYSKVRFIPAIKKGKFSSSSITLVVFLHYN